MEFLTKSLMPYKNSFKCKIKKQRGIKKKIFLHNNLWNIKALTPKRLWDGIKREGGGIRY